MSHIVLIFICDYNLVVSSDAISEHEVMKILSFLLTSECLHDLYG